MDLNCGSSKSCTLNDRGGKFEFTVGAMRVRSALVCLRHGHAGLQLRQALIAAVCWGPANCKWLAYGGGASMGRDTRLHGPFFTGSGNRFRSSREQTD